MIDALARLQSLVTSDDDVARAAAAEQAWEVYDSSARVNQFGLSALPGVTPVAAEETGDLVATMTDAFAQLAASAEAEASSAAAERLRGAFRRYPTGVAVITAAGPSGPVGLTASGVASVSLDPPALFFSVQGSRSGRALLAAPSLVVHLLGSRHADLARDFSRTGGPRFTAQQGWGILPSGEPLLAGVPAALRCVPLHRVPVGAATVVVATVLRVHLGPDDGHLVHHDGRFVTAGPVPAL